MADATQTPDQLPALAALSPSAETIAWEPGGPTSKVSIKLLLGRLISTEEATATEAELQALLAYDANALALVFADPVPANCGWYRKIGATGTGNWVLFEHLSGFALDAATALVGQAQAAAGQAQASAAQTAAAIAALGFNSPWPRGSHLYWRLVLTAHQDGGNRFAINDVEFRAKPGGLNQTAGGTPFADSSDEGSSVANAFDGVESSVWFSYAFPCHIGYQFGSPVSVGEIAVRANYDHAGEAPQAWTLQWSDDGAAYTDAWTVTSQTAWQPDETRAFTDPYYGLVSTKVVLGSAGSSDLFVADPAGGYDKLPGGGGAGSSAFQRLMLPALAGGRLTREDGLFNANVTTASAPIVMGSLTVNYVALNGDTPPNGFAATNRALWSAAPGRFEGGLLTAAGNGLSTLLALRNTTNADPRNSCNSSRWRTKVKGAAGGSGLAIQTANIQPMKLVVDGVLIGVYTIGSYDQGYVFDLRWTDALDHNVELIAAGPLPIYNVWWYGGGIAAPAARPRFGLLGTSVMEDFFYGWSATFCDVLGVEGWGMGLGSTGVLQPAGTRGNLLQRSLDFTDQPFDAVMHEGVINDAEGHDPLYNNDTSYANVFKTMRDQYRRVLDAWEGSQNAGKPWFATGYVTPGAPASAIAMTVRDALQQVCGEYRSFAHFIDPFPTGYLWETEGSGGQRPSSDLSDDGVHPNRFGGLVLGMRRADEVSALIRAGRF